MNKKGFVLIETIIVLLVVVVSLVGLYKGYNLVFMNLKQKMYYDNVNDIYKVNVIKNLFNNTTYLTDNTSLKIINNTNCSSNAMSSNCTSALNDLELDHIILTTGNINADIENTNLTNSDTAYLNILEDGKKYLIISYRFENKDYYASLRVG